MKDLKGKAAFVTGAASGIGLGIARMLAREGVNVALADIQADKVEAARRDVESFGVKATGIVLDVSVAAEVERAADQAEAALGPIHIVCNNAGITMARAPVETVTRQEWDWVIGVNLYGVINGVTAFLPRLRRHGQGGHIVNTASMAGIIVNKERQSGSYAVTKFGVVALSEALRNELDPSIGVSVLCPAAVKTDIYASSLHRPARFGGSYHREGGFRTKADLEKGLPPDVIGGRVVDAIRGNEFFILTHSWGRANLQRRHDELMEAFDRAEAFEKKLMAKAD